MSVHRFRPNALERIEEGKIKKKHQVSNKKSQVNKYKGFTSAKNVHKLPTGGLPAKRGDFITAKQLKEENETVQHMKYVYEAAHGHPVEAKYGLEGHSKKRKAPSLNEFAEQMSHTVVPTDKYHEPLHNKIRKMNEFDANPREASEDPFVKGRDILKRRQKVRANATRTKRSGAFAGPRTYRRRHPV